MSELARLSRQLAELVPLIGTSGFLARLVGLLRHWVRIDEASLLVYPGIAEPFIAYREGVTGTPPNLDTFITGPFLLDPYYVAAARQQKFGFFALADLAPVGFRSSEYYRTYYRYNGFNDECGYLIGDVMDGFANLSLARTAGQRPFERSRLRLLADFTTLIDALVREQLARRRPETVARETSLRLRLEKALSEFGRPQLTPREQQTISAILHGHTSKAIAADLRISVETVKLHRKNAYRKLGIRNQTELFSTFINTVTATPSRT